MKKHLFASAMIVLGLCANAQTQQRMALYEEFTGETCPPCAATNPGLNALLEQPQNQTKVIAIKWQVPIPSAPTKTWSLYQTDKADIDWRWKTGGYGYNINSAPSGRMDGQDLTAFGIPGSPSTADHPAYLTSAAIASAAAVPTSFDLKIERRWSSDLSTVNLTITVDANSAFTSAGNLMLRTVMVERLVTFSVQPGTNGEKVFEDPVISCYPTTKTGTVVTGMGTALKSTWAKGDQQVITMSFPVPSYTRKLDQIAIVGFIQDDGNRKIYQAYRAEPVGTIPNDARIMNLQAPVAICTNSFQSVVTIQNNGSTDITSMVISPSLDGVAATPINWSGALYSGSSITLTLDPMSSTVAGGHQLSVDISNVSGGDNNTTDNVSVSTVYLGVGTTGKMVTQDFEAAAFPPPLFGLSNTDKGAAWSLANGATIGGFGSSTGALKYDFYNNKKIGDKDEFYLPPTNLYGTADPELVYEYAYVQNGAATPDKLEVMASSDCGTTWTTFHTASGTSLATTQTLIVGAFVPNASEHWGFQSVKLPGMNVQDVLVKFVVTNGNGNNLYLDNINLMQSEPTDPPSTDPTGLAENNGTKFFAGLFPNPTSGNVSVKITSPVSGNAVITVVNTLGQLVVKKNTVLNGGNNVVDLNVSELPSGIYSVNIESSNGTFSKKLTVSK